MNHTAMRWAIVRQEDNMMEWDGLLVKVYTKMTGFVALKAVRLIDQS